MSLHAASALEALSDDTRRAILDRLREGERAVGELATGLPVTRPAVSQHLKVLRDAGLVVERVEGTRHLYRLAPTGLAAVRTYVEGLWDVTLGRYATAAREARRIGGDMPTSVIAPVLKTIVVPLPADAAFELFFAGMSSWWPLDTHSVYEADAKQVTVEERLGGHITERGRGRPAGRSGERSSSGTRARRAVFTWHPGYTEDSATEVEVRFSAEGDGLTRVDLEHRSWDALGARAEATREGYDSGWNTVFAVRFGSAAQARSRRPHPASLVAPRCTGPAAVGRHPERRTRASPAAPPHSGSAAGLARRSAVGRHCVAVSLSGVATRRATSGRRTGVRLARRSSSPEPLDWP